MLRTCDHFLSIAGNRTMSFLKLKAIHHEPLLRNLSSNLSSASHIDENCPNDKFTMEFQKNYVQLSTTQKLILTAGSSVMALINPYRQDMVACLGETTGKYALQEMLKQMQDNDEGRRILIEKPRINSETIDIDKLRNLPDNTFGRTYVKFLDDNQVTPDSRLPVKFIDDSELAYVMTRYRECHDMFHTILGVPIDMLGEVSVKWFEALNTKMPMCYGAAVFGALTLSSQERKMYSEKYLPWAILNGKRAKPLLPVYWETKWENDITKFRNELGISTLQ